MRLALEERGIDYTSFHVNPITGKNMDSLFFRMNPSAKLPVLQNGSEIIYDTVEITQYVSSSSHILFFVTSPEIFDLALGSCFNCR